MPNFAPSRDIPRADHIRLLGPLTTVLKAEGHTEFVHGAIRGLAMKNPHLMTLSCSAEDMIKHLENYRFITNSKASRYGQCCYTTKTIELSTRISADEEARNHTLMHEIAHAISYHMFHYSGHGPIWKMCDIALGNNGARCGNPMSNDEEATMRMPVVYRCPNGHLRGQSRRSSRQHSCGRCSTRFDIRYLMPRTMAWVGSLIASSYRCGREASTSLPVGYLTCVIR